MQPTSSPRTLILGASGQLGTALTAQLGDQAIPAARRQLDPAWLHLDLAEIAANPAVAPDELAGLIAKHNITAVICAAGATDVERCESDHAWASAANHLGPLALARAAHAIPFVFFSTDYVFDGVEAPGKTAGPYSETDQPNPLSVYGRTKLEGEQSILAVHPCALVIRTTTVYGPDPQKKNFLYTLSRLLGDSKPMRVPTDQLANPTYVTDLATATLALLKTKATGLFHAAGPDFLSRYDFALEACRLLALDPTTMSPVTTPELAQKAARPLLGGLASNKLASTLGHNPMRPIAQGIPDWQSSLKGLAPIE